MSGAMSYVVMAFIVMVYSVMAYIVMAHIDIAYVVNVPYEHAEPANTPHL